MELNMKAIIPRRQNYAIILKVRNLKILTKISKNFEPL